MSKNKAWLGNIESLTTYLKGSNKDTVMNDNPDELDNMIEHALNATKFIDEQEGEDKESS